MEPMHGRLTPSGVYEAIYLTLQLLDKKQPGILHQLQEHVLRGNPLAPEALEFLERYPDSDAPLVRDGLVNQDVQNVILHLAALKRNEEPEN